MFRKATMNDLDQLEELFDRVHTEEEAGRVSTGWIRGVYPTRKTVESAICADDLFVAEADGKIVATGRINTIQMPEYAVVDWVDQVTDDQVMVLHMLAVLPEEQGKGYGPAFERFYEKYSIEQGRPYLRIDTNEKNLRARALYKRLGYRESGIVPCVFNGIDGVHLVCLEKRAE